jgi:hypothetical protein
MYLGIDHLVIAVDDPEAAATQLEREVGLAATGSGRHDTLGTYNRVAWLGDSYIELIGVFDRPLAERSWLGRPTLQALDAGGGLATWAIATDALDADLEHLRAAGSDLDDAVAGERRRPDGAIVRWRFSAAPLLGPVEAPFLIEHDPTSAEWTPADRALRSGDSFGLEALELSVDNVQVTSQRMGRAVGLRFRPSLAGGGARDANLGDQIVRLRPRRGATSAAVIRLRGPGRDLRNVDLFGCRWVVDPPVSRG